MMLRAFAFVAIFQSQLEHQCLLVIARDDSQSVELMHFSGRRTT